MCVQFFFLVIIQRLIDNFTLTFRIQIEINYNVVLNEPVTIFLRCHHFNYYNYARAE